MNARDQILGRIRAALRDVPGAERPEDHPVAREYLPSHATRTPRERTDLLAENLADYRALVHRSTGPDLPALIARLLARRGSRSVLLPAGLPPEWSAQLDASVERVGDLAEQSARRLDAVDTVLTGCALAIAETGTIVLDGSAGQGRRRVTLVPDHHVCVVRTPGQVVDSVPQALRRLDPARPLTWISGPSATSDIELDRVEGVHGPRTLEVVLLEELEE